MVQEAPINENDLHGNSISNEETTNAGWKDSAENMTKANKTFLYQIKDQRIQKLKHETKTKWKI